MQARWGSHGCYSLIALSPDSPQEVFDLTIRAFNLAEIYRVPVLVMSEAAVGHMHEKVVVPPVEEIERVHRRKPTVPPEEYLPYRADPDLVPPMANAGDGYRFHVTGLTHDERGYPSMTVEAQDKLVRRLIDKIEKNKHYIIDIEEDGIDGADVVVCSYGVSARVSRLAIQQARNQGIKVGFLRLITIWPFPEERIRHIARKVEAFVVPELNSGQISLEVERCAGGQAKTLLVSHLGGAVHNPDVILSTIKKAVK